MLMGFDQLRNSWETFAQVDPLWAILTETDKTGNRWDIAAFFRTGRSDVDRFVAQAQAALGDSWDPARGRALDFGCGVGRLTQGLGAHFAEVVGVDIAPTMISRAGEYNTEPDRIRFLVNDADDLSQFDDASFDFVLAWIVLQHMDPQIGHNYVREFLRVLRPGGGLLFQLPYERRVYVEELPDTALKGRVRIGARLRKVAAGTAFDLPVRVTNTSKAIWPADFVETPIRVGNHWLDLAGEVVQFDDGRAALLAPLPPGQSATLQLSCSAPLEPGRYELVVDLVREGVGWFVDRGNRVDSCTVRVTPAGRSRERVAASPPRDAAGQGDRLGEAVMEMHTTPIAVIEELVTAAGGEICHRETWSNPSFLDVEYIVRKL